MDQLRLRFQKGDILAVVLVVVLIVAVMLFHIPQEENSGAIVQVYRDGTLLQEFPLSQDKIFCAEGKYFNTIVVQNGAVSITDSNCPGNDCVLSGRIDSPGRSIVCLPNRVEVRIVSSVSDVDFVVG